MNIRHIFYSLAMTLSLCGTACGMADTGNPDLVTEIPTDEAAKKVLGAEAIFCLESTGNWNTKEQHCLITEKLCTQVGDWIGKSCSIPVTDCIEEGSHKEGSKCVIAYYSKEHMQTIMGNAQP